MHYPNKKQNPDKSISDNKTFSPHAHDSELLGTGIPKSESPTNLRISSQQSKLSARRIALSALLVTLALMFSYVEAIIPFNPGIPGVKLGIANLVILVSLYHLGTSYALTANLIRILIAGLLFNGLFGALYSLAGAMLSFLTMILLKKTNLFSTIGVSIAGGVTHNFGQLIVAAFLISNVKIFIYFPVLIFSGLISGALIGVLAHLILVRLPKPY